MGKFALLVQVRVADLELAVAPRLAAELGEAWSMQDAAVRQAAHASCVTEVRRALEALARGQPPGGSLSQATVRAVTVWARGGLPVGLLLRAFWIGEAVLWDCLSGEVEDAGGSRGVGVLREAHHTLGVWMDHVAAAVAERFTVEQRRSGGGEQRRLALVGELLGGGSVGSGTLGYELSLEHVAVIAWGDGAAVGVVQLARTLREQLLRVDAGDGVWWGWLGSSGGRSAREYDALRRFKHESAVRFAFGEPRASIDGFRESHREALDAREVSLISGASVALHRDVALEALTLGGGDERTRRFVERELRGFSGTDRRSRLDRETVEAYLAAGQSASAAAARLRVKRDTITNRLRRLEEEVGPIDRRHAEIAVALRLHRLFSSR